MTLTTVTLPLETSPEEKQILLRTTEVFNRACIQFDCDRETNE